MKLIPIIFVPLLIILSGCTTPESNAPDQCLRKQYFDDCLKNLPAGQDSTKYSDWDEVVQTCENSAYYQSIRIKSIIKPECASR